MLCCVALVRADVSEEHIASNIRVIIGELGTLAIIATEAHCEGILNIVSSN
jgi:hypothetical protein